MRTFQTNLEFNSSSPSRIFLKFQEHSLTLVPPLQEHATRYTAHGTGKLSLTSVTFRCAMANSHRTIASTTYARVSCVPATLHSLEKTSRAAATSLRWYMSAEIGIKFTAGWMRTGRATNGNLVKRSCLGCLQTREARMALRVSYGRSYFQGVCTG